ncbi:MAG: hypothetical protein IJX05_01720 [Clostridia bacterium]|nr:hypothetical protein [Clostridia bacterium]
MFNILSEINSDTLAISLVVVLLFVLLTIAVTLVAVFLIGKYHQLTKDDTVQVGKLKTTYLVAIILVVGLAIRVLMALVVNGYGENFQTVYDIGKNALKDGNGFEGFANNYLGIAPIMGYLYAFFAGLGSSAGLAVDDLAMQLFVKAPYILADIALFVTLYMIAKKYSNRYVALIIASLYYLSPLSFVMSSAWGSEYTVLALALVLTFYFMVNKNVFGMSVGMAVSCLVHSDAIVIAPVIAVYLIYVFVKSIIKIVKVKPSFDMIFKDASLYNVVYVPLCIALGVVLMYLLSLPAYLPDGVVGFGEVMEKILVSPFLYVSGESALYYFSQNALSLYTVLTLNFTTLGAKFASALFVGLFALVVAIVAAVIFIMKKNRANLLLLASYLSVTVGIYLIGASEWTLVPALALMLIAFAIIKDKRILKVYAIMSVFVALNALLAMLGGNQISSELVLGVFNMGSETAFNVFSILLSVLTVLVHIYYTVVVLDISLTKNRKLFVTEPTSSVGEIMKNWVR